MCACVFVLTVRMLWSGKFDWMCDYDMYLTLLTQIGSKHREFFVNQTNKMYIRNFDHSIYIFIANGSLSFSIISHIRPICISRVSLVCPF